MQPAAVAPLLAKGGVTVLDLRTASEFSAKHIPGATNLNCQATDFSAQLAKLDRNQPYLIHCATGRRSTNALTEFQKLGFKHVIHLDGGLRAWEAGKNQVTKD
jgi:rhodanese-related sulfurtransferase